MRGSIPDLSASMVGMMMQYEMIETVIYYCSVAKWIVRKTVFKKHDQFLSKLYITASNRSYSVTTSPTFFGGIPDWQLKPRAGRLYPDQGSNTGS